MKKKIIIISLIISLCLITTLMVQASGATFLGGKAVDSQNQENKQIKCDKENIDGSTNDPSKIKNQEQKGNLEQKMNKEMNQYQQNEQNQSQEQIQEQNQIQEQLNGQEQSDGQLKEQSQNRTKNKIHDGETTEE